MQLLRVIRLSAFWNGTFHRKCVDAPQTLPLPWAEREHELGERPPNLLNTMQKQCSSRNSKIMYTIVFSKDVKIINDLVLVLEDVYIYIILLLDLLWPFIQCFTSLKVSFVDKLDYIILHYYFCRNGPSDLYCHQLTSKNKSIFTFKRWSSSAIRSLAHHPVLGATLAAMMSMANLLVLRLLCGM